MFIKNIKLINFRNYNSLELEFSKNFNIIFGDNAQGKTNILEAIFLCASSRSHRTTKDSELIKLGESGSLVKLIFDKGNTETSIDILFCQNDKKKVSINELPIKKIGNLIGNLNVVIFSPEDLSIIKEGPSERRRLIDITLSQIKPTYFYDLQQYAKVLTQRNNLLRELQRNKNLFDTLEIWNSNLVGLGSRIIKARYEFISKLSTIAEANHYTLTNNKEKLYIKYTPSIKVDGFTNIKDIENAFLKALKCSLDKELLKCTTLSGPQRDDCEIFIDDRNTKLFGSQGQQRTAILSIKLSEINIMTEATGQIPVLLLDDVMSELDSKRQEYLLNSLENVQTFITSTDNDYFKNRSIKDSRFFHVRSGQVIMI